MTVAVAADAAGDVKVIDVATPVLEQLRAFHAALRSGGAANASGDAAAAVSAARRLAWQSESQSRGYIMDRRATKKLFIGFLCLMQPAELSSLVTSLLLPQAASHRSMLCWHRQ